MSFHPKLQHIRQNGACHGTTDPESWFPQDRSVPSVVATHCARCPVRRECLEWAIERREWGVWGGTTDLQRKKLRTRKR